MHNKAAKNVPEMWDCAMDLQFVSKFFWRGLAMIAGCKQERLGRYELADTPAYAPNSRQTQIGFLKNNTVNCMLIIIS